MDRRIISARAIRPSKASTSLTRCPLPNPPMAGLQDIAPIVSRAKLTSAVRTPMRAAAVAASTPACPPPTTTTSKSVSARLLIVRAHSAPWGKGQNESGCSTWNSAYFPMQNRPNSASSISSVLALPVKASRASRAWRSSSAMISGSCALDACERKSAVSRSKCRCL